MSLRYNIIFVLFLLPCTFSAAPSLAVPNKPDLASSIVQDQFRLSSLLTQFDEQILWLFVGLMAFFIADLLVVLIGRRKAENALKDSMAQHNLLLNSAAEGIYGLDLDGKCTFCNPACLRLLGYKNEDELLGKNLHEIIHHTRIDGSPYPASECKICHAYLHNSEVHLEDECLWRSDGSSFPVEYWSYPLIKGKNTIGAVVSFLDISDRKFAEQKLIAANKEMDAFVYTVSHDLRTPISAVIGYADLVKEMCREELTEEAIDLLNTIELQGEKMSLIVEDLLALATAGNIVPPSQPVEVKGVIDYVVDELSREIQTSGTNIVLGDLPAVQVPESLLIQVFENLIGNALHYSGSTRKDIEIAGERIGHRSSYYVRDHGQGIPVEEREKIFDVFFRGSTGDARAGSGVGLATVQKICRLYGGVARVEETPGGGATFRVDLVDADQLTSL